MPKLDKNQIDKAGIHIFNTKAEMIKYIKKANFKDYTMQIYYLHKKWVVRWNR